MTLNHDRAAPTIGSLFTGYGGLDMGVQAAIGGTVAWQSEIDPAASRVLAHHWPDVPNLGDITKADWTAVEPVDVLVGGFPCQDLSTAGSPSTPPPSPAGSRSSAGPHPTPRNPIRAPDGHACPRRSPNG